MTDEQTATEIMRTFYDDDGPSMHAAIVRALQAARTPPPGHIIDDAGVVRRVLGEIPVTDDGCVVGKFAKVWVVSHGGTQIKQVQLDDPRKGWVMSPKCYSTREAAEAAKESK